VVIYYWYWWKRKRKRKRRRIHYHHDYPYQKIPMYYYRQSVVDSYSGVTVPVVIVDVVLLS
tara:strand:+ start:225 stop:407 length:183 start_codon:yes stop_codon:yes gene_type:complete